MEEEKVEKYCPNCGKKLKASDRFCDKCGADVSKVPAAQNQSTHIAQPSSVNTQRNTQPQNNQRQLQRNKNHTQKIRNYCLIIGTVIVCAAAILMVVITFQNQSKASHPVVIKQEQKKSKSSSSSSQQSSSSQSSSVDSDNDSDETRHYNRNAREWTNSQEDKLADFMDDFGDKMDQDYDQYDGDASDGITNAGGISYPDAFHDDDFRLNGNRINIGWDPSLRKDYDYHVVSIFNYDGTKGANDDEDDDDAHITYLFAVHNGHPVALVEQTPSDDDDVEVKETANHDVRTAFANIYENK